MPERSPLRVALLAYRGNPYSGGQGVYVKHLSAALTRLGHEVTVFAGQPYPELTDGLPLVPVPSLDLYRTDDPFRLPRRDEFRDWIDVLEYLTLCSAAFPEPLTFSLRARRLLLARRAQFDIVHDNECLGWGCSACTAPACRWSPASITRLSSTVTSSSLAKSVSVAA